MNTTGVIVTVIALLVASVFALWWRARSGRVTSVTGGDSSPQVNRLADLAEGRITLIQFSAEVCSQCAATRRLLTKVSGQYDEVSHVEVDVTQELDAVRELDIRRTPTTFVVTGDGAIAFRVSGVPREDELTAAITGLLSTERDAHAAVSEVE